MTTACQEGNGAGGSRGSFDFAPSRVPMQFVRTGLSRSAASRSAAKFVEAHGAYRHNLNRASALLEKFAAHSQARGHAEKFPAWFAYQRLKQLLTIIKKVHDEFNDAEGTVRGRYTSNGLVKVNTRPRTDLETVTLTLNCAHLAR
jgi:hypothetical protein